MVRKFSYADTDSIVKIGERPDQVAGVDVSKYQGEVDWKALRKAGYIFAIIRAGYGMFSSQVDPYFVQNMIGAKDNGFDIGVYWFSYATNTADAEKEAALCYETIKPYIANINIGVFFDYEYDSVEYYYNKYEKRPSPDLTVDMFLTFDQYLKRHNLKTGIYTNYDYITTYFKGLDYDSKEFLLWFSDPSNKYRDNYSWDICQTGILDIDGGSFDINIMRVHTVENPDEDNFTIYTITSGDTLSEIASKYGMSLSELLDWNPEYITKPNVIYEGQIVKVKKPIIKLIELGDIVKIKKDAKYYYGVNTVIPEYCKGIDLTVQQVKSDRILLKEIFSWVAINDVEKAE